MNEIITSIIIAIIGIVGSYFVANRTARKVNKIQLKEGQILLFEIIIDFLCVKSTI